MSPCPLCKQLPEGYSVQTLWLSPCCQLPAASGAMILARNSYCSGIRPPGIFYLCNPCVCYLGFWKGELGLLPYSPVVQALIRIISDWWVFILPCGSSPGTHIVFSLTLSGIWLLGVLGLAPVSFEHFPVMSGAPPDAPAPRMLPPPVLSEHWPGTSPFSKKPCSF